MHLSPRYSFIVLVCTVAIFGGAAIAPQTVYAQSASNDEQRRVNARALFSAGIDLQHRSDYGQALEKFEAANRFFPAPTITLHIAQCKANLGKLVEAAESYRALERTQPDPSWTPAFHQAKDQGRTELQQVEARTPKIIIDVEPHAPGLQIQFDGSSMDLVFLGVPRAVNPGKHRLVAFAPGYPTGEQAFEVREEDAKKVRTEVLKLAAQSSGTAAGAIPASNPGGTAGATPAASAATVGQANATNANALGAALPTDATREASSTFMGGVGLGYLFPTGSIPGEPLMQAPTSGLAGDANKLSNFVGSGFSLDLLLGFRFRQLTIGGLYQGAAVGLGNGRSGSTHFLGAQVGFLSRPEGVGLAAELAVGGRLLSFDLSNSSTKNFTGLDVMAGLGLGFRVARGVRMIPKITFSYGNFSNAKTTVGNTTLTSNQETEAHTFWGLAVGGQFDIYSLSRP